MVGIGGIRRRLRRSAASFCTVRQLGQLDALCLKQRAVFSDGRVGPLEAQTREQFTAANR